MSLLNAQKAVPVSKEENTSSNIQQVKTQSPPNDSPYLDEINKLKEEFKALSMSVREIKTKKQDSGTYWYFRR